MAEIKIKNEFFIAPNAIFELGFKPIEISVYMYLLRCGNNSTAFPSYSTIGKKVGISRDCAINTVKKLIEKKVVMKHERTKDIKKKKDGKIIALHDSNIYEVIINLDNLVVEDDHGSRSGRPPLVVEDDHGSRSGRPPLVVEDDPINNYIKNNYEKELKDKELSKNNILSSEEKKEDEKQRHSLVESEDSTNNSENNNDSSDKPKKKKTKTYDLESQELKASKYLFDLITKNDERAKVPDFQKWAYHIDLLVRVDNRTFSEVKDVIDWCQNDSFWKSNILSTEKLRKQFSKLFILMNEGNNRSDIKTNKKESTMSILKRMHQRAKAKESGIID
jgi:hypothetical protein